MYTKLDKKFIIAFKNGKIKHFIFPLSLFHDTFARDNGIDLFSQALEYGIIIEGKYFNMEYCRNKLHKEKKDFNLLPKHLLRARELQTIKAYGIQREGD